MTKEKRSTLQYERLCRRNDFLPMSEWVGYPRLRKSYGTRLPLHVDDDTNIFFGVRCFGSSGHVSFS